MLKTEWEVGDSHLRLLLKEGEDGPKGGPFVPNGNQQEWLIALEPFGYTNVPELGQKALAFGVFTRLRNATAGKAFAEAKAAINAAIESFKTGNWTAERESSAVPFGPDSLLVRAVIAAAPNFSATEVVEKLSAKAEVTAKANFAVGFSELSVQDRAKVRKAVVEHYARQPAIAKSLLELEARAQAERLARKRASLPFDGEGEVQL